MIEPFSTFALFEHASGPTPQVEYQERGNVVMTAEEPGGTRTYARARSRAAEIRRRRSAIMVGNDVMRGDIRPPAGTVNARPVCPHDLARRFALMVLPPRWHSHLSWQD